MFRDILFILCLGTGVIMAFTALFALMAPVERGITGVMIWCCLGAGAANFLFAWALAEMDE